MIMYYLESKKVKKTKQFITEKVLGDCREYCHRNKLSRQSFTVCCVDAPCNFVPRLGFIACCLYSTHKTQTSFINNTIGKML